MSDREIIFVEAPTVEPLTIIEQAPSSFRIEETSTEIVDIRLIRGPSGSSWQPLSYTQETPATIWNINHNLGYYPTVNVFDVAGNAIECAVTMISVNQMILTFSTPMIGVARLI